MPAPICTLCGEREASAILTNLETGDTESPCAVCFPSFILAIAESLAEAGRLDADTADGAGDDGGGGGADDDDPEGNAAARIAGVDPTASGGPSPNTSSADTADANGEAPANTEQHSAVASDT